MEYKIIIENDMKQEMTMILDALFGRKNNQNSNAASATSNHESVLRDGGFLAQNLTGTLNDGGKALEEREKAEGLYHDSTMNFTQSQRTRGEQAATQRRGHTFEETIETIGQNAADKLLQDLKQRR